MLGLERDLESAAEPPATNVPHKGLKGRQAVTNVEETSPGDTNKAGNSLADLEADGKSYGELLAKEGPGFAVGSGPWHVSSRVFDFSGLQRMNMKHLQNKLINSSAEISRKNTASPEELDEICTTLEKYGKLTYVQNKNSARTYLELCLLI
jgi:hypothetical protein